MTAMPQVPALRRFKAAAQAVQAARWFAAIPPLSTTTYIHEKARRSHPAYPARAPVQDEQVSWFTHFPTYKPTPFEHPCVAANDRTKKAGGWADPQNHRVLDFTKRKSYTYAQRQQGVSSMVLDSEGRPMNPMGRTGMCGRGLLGKWGANHAADPLVTRYAEVEVDDGTGTGHTTTKRVLQMVAIKRKDNGEWAIPGGMVDDGEKVSATLMREFREEAVSMHAADVAGAAGKVDGVANRGAQFEALLQELFHESNPNARFVYKGYVDDPRNTDNAWMETWCMHYHIPPQSPLAEMLSLGLRAGDDASEVEWLTIQEGNERFGSLYASHKSMVMKAVQQMQ